MTFILKELYDALIEAEASKEKASAAAAAVLKDIAQPKPATKDDGASGMADEVSNLILEHLQAVRIDQQIIISDLRDIKKCLERLERRPDET